MTKYVCYISHTMRAILIYFVYVDSIYTIMYRTKLSFMIYHIIFICITYANEDGSYEIIPH